MIFHPKLDRDDWAQRLMCSALSIPVASWGEVCDAERDQWRRAADVLLDEQSRLLAIEDALQNIDLVLHPYDSLDELVGMCRVAVDAVRSVDAYLRDLHPALPKHYGMPVDGVRHTIRALGYDGEPAADLEASN